MNDLEQLLRAEMLDATDDIYADVDLDSVMASGDRVLKGRFVRRSLGAVAAVAAVGMIVYAGLVNRPVTANPAPVATVSASTTPHPTPDTRSWASVKISWSGEAQDPDGRTVSVRATPAGDGFDVAAEIIDAAGGAQELTGHATSERPVVFRITPAEWVMVTGGAVAWAQAAQTGGGEWFPQSDDQVRFPGLAATATVIQTWDESATLAGVLWADAAGGVRDQDGLTVPQASLKMKGRTFSFVRDAKTGLACSAEVLRGKPLVEDCSQLEAPAGTSHTLIEANGGCGVRDGNCYGGYPEVFAYVVLPEGSADVVTFDFAKGLTCAVADGPIGSTGRRVYMVRCTPGANGEANVAFTAAHYRDAAGNPVTFRP